MYFADVSAECLGASGRCLGKSKGCVRGVWGLSDISEGCFRGVKFVGGMSGTQTLGGV